MALFEIGIVVAMAAGSFASLPPVQPIAGEAIDGLRPAERALFFIGRAQYARPFTEAEGLGPAFNARNCGACHEAPLGGWGPSSVQHFGRVREDGSYDYLEEFGGPVRQQFGISPACIETLPPEATHVRERVTPSVLAFGLVEALTDAQLATHADPDDLDGDGVSGRVHMVPLLAQPASPLRAGRFGWKSQIASVLDFSGDAARTEMGITNEVIADETAPNGDLGRLESCDAFAEPENSSASAVDFVGSVTAFQRYLSPPPQTPRTGMRGEAVFNAIGCATCHTPSFTTPDGAELEDALRSVTFRPYSDFLLHDMGDMEADGIGDGIPEGDAGPFEMRTPPLWNLRDRSVMLHDGSAGEFDFAERVHAAILRHGGEADASRTAYLAADATAREDLIRFLDSLGRLEFDVDGDGIVDLADLGLLVPFIDEPIDADHPAAVADIDLDGRFDGEEYEFLAKRLRVDTDCNQDGISDAVEIASGLSLDVDGNGVPDECDAAFSCAQRVIRLIGMPLDGSAAIDIPDNDPNGVTLPLPAKNIPVSGFVRRVVLSLSLEHTWLSDLTASLANVDAPSTQSAFKTALGGDICGSPGDADLFAADLDGIYRFRQSADLRLPCQALTFVQDGCTPKTSETCVFLPSGEFRVKNLSPASWFDGGSFRVESEWRLKIADKRGEDLGRLRFWMLDIVYSPDSFSPEEDCDGDGLPNTCDEDLDEDGNSDLCEQLDSGPRDCNGNELFDDADLFLGTSLDCDLNGVPDECQLDSDGDGAIDACDDCPSNPRLIVAGKCGCADATDGDGDGVPDCLDNCVSAANPTQEDCDGDGTGDACEAPIDCNGNGTLDACDILSGTSSDLDGDGIPDECSGDCDGDGTADAVEIAAGAPDCNGNGVPDECDLSSGESTDLDGNAVPDECGEVLIVGGSGFASIQAAIDAASDGATILVSSGTYGPISVSRRRVEIRRLDAGQSVTVDGLGTARAISIIGAEANGSTLDGLVVRNGFAELGGGLLVRDCSPLVRDCRFIGNTASDTGGGIALERSGAALEGCVIEGNQALVGGGIAVLDAASKASVTLRGCAIVGNAADEFGGGIACLGRLSIDGGSSIAGNVSALGGGIGIEAIATVDATATDFCLNLPENAVGRFAVLDASVRFGGDCDGDGVCDLDALDGGTAVDCNGNLRPDSCDIADATSADADGNGIPDECGAAVFVPNAQFATIQSAVLAVDPGTTIWVLPGVYNERIDLTGKRIVLRSTAGAAQTILDGTGLDGPILQIDPQTPAQNTASDHSRVGGFTFRNGTTGTLFPGTNRKGGAIYVTGKFAQPIFFELENCRFEGNSAEFGGAIYAKNLRGTIGQCIFENNRAQPDAPDQAGGDGGAIELFRGSWTIRDCVFSENSASFAGGAIHIDHSSGSRIEGSTLIGNISLDRGAGISWSQYDDALINASSPLTVTGCLLQDNVSPNGAAFETDCVSCSGMACDAFQLQELLLCRNEPRNIIGFFADGGGNYFSDDCDADGVCDAQQIALGEAPDDNGNGVIDTCEPTADFDGDGLVNATDMAILLSAWGGGGTPDLTGDGVVNAADITGLLAQWSTAAPPNDPCPEPNPACPPGLQP